MMRLKPSHSPPKRTQPAARSAASGPATVQRPNRWDEPFSHDMTDEKVAFILTHEPFCRMDPDKFPGKLPLHSIIKNDCALRNFKDGEIIVREGDYGSSAFVILKGTVRVVLTPSLPPTILGRRQPRRKGLWGTIAQAMKRPTPPELRRVSRRPGRAGADRAKGHDDAVHHRSDATTAPQERDAERIVLQDVPAVLSRHKTARMSVYRGRIQEGNLFGEIGALGRLPRSATVFSEDASSLVEIRWQGLRDIMRSAPETREHVERTFRENMFNVALRTHPLFDREHLSDDALQQIADASAFQMHGQFDWYGTFRKVAGKDTAERLGVEPVIAREGHYPNGVTVILAGFARLSKRHGHGERTVNYLGVLQSYGQEEVYHNWKHPDRPVPLRHTLRAVGYLNTLFVPTAVLEKYVFPALPEAARPVLSHSQGATAADPSPVSHVDTPPPPSKPVHDRGRIGTDLLEFLVESRVINGTRTMVIDLNRCTRCDDCVRACATVHDNNPRFIRHGIRNGPYMIPNACMHCADPVCMIGCPTGAIHRLSDGGNVVINDLTCIGCQQCANNCPYDNIRMVQVRDQRGTLLMDDKGLPILQATKCDFCVDQPGGPACERACPHDALVRLDTTRIEPLADWLQP